MARIKILFINIILLSFLFRAEAQSSFNSGGGDDAVSQASVSYSIGQLFYEPSSSYGGSLKATPGVQQTYFIADVTSNETIISDVADIKLYPNPVTDYLELLFTGEERFDNLKATLYSISGSLIGIYPVNIPLTRIEAGTLEPGVYMLKVTNGDMEIKTFKIIKK